MERKPTRHARTRSGAGSAGGGAGAVLASFLRSTAASFSSSTTNFTARAVGGKSSFNHRNAFSGPMVSIVPPEARRRRGSRQAGGGSGSGFRTPEASSPKVSCIGQIKRSKSKRKTKAARKAAKHAPVTVIACGMDGGACPLPPRPPAASRPKRSLVKRMLFRRSGSRSLSSKSSGADGFKGRGSTVAAAPAPAAGLGQMKRFTSGRAAFQDFDWTTEQAEPRRGSDVDGFGDGGYDSFEDDGFVAHSAPLVLGGGMVASEPRKEVNLWRRRPMSPPTPLQLPGNTK